ncbi:FCD domain-containing protein [Curtobacterium sp. TC1]|uniref:FCD domain-containing protein n=1 Tax=Curtobacterium sp. TC1 TaxID=2862880 RepID=UPI001C9B427B|nr:FCD domain-containing protein [Curtobacterium sp. TC1]QZQ55995.1 FCD domain-containing protein [Curtobacterium sp. TC1]
MTAVARFDDGWTPQFDQAYRNVLGAVRDGSLGQDVAHDELALSGQFDLDPVVLHAVLERLCDVGLAVLDDRAAVRFRSLSPAAWVDNGWLLVGLLEGVMRSAVPVLTAADRAEQGRVAETLRRSAHLRTPELDPAFWASIAFWIDRTPNASLGRLTARAVERARFGVTPSIPFRSTEVDAWAAAAEQAVRYPGVRSAERAAHVLARLWGEHVDAAAAAFGKASDDGSPSSSAYSAPEDSPSWAVWTPDDLWWDLLALVRDGTLERDRTYRADEIAARLRQSVRRLMPMVRRLELLGLVETRPDDPEAVRITRPDLQHWTDSLQLASTLVEACARWSVPTLDDTGRAELHDVIDRLRRQGRIRDYGYTMSVVELSRLLADHTPNPWLAGSLRFALSRLAFVFDEAPPFRRWDIEDVLTQLEDAIDRGDPDRAADAAHALNVHYDAHIVDVVARLSGTES